MAIDKKERIYKATRESSLLDYSLFNQNSKNQDKKNEFLNLLFRSLQYSEYFNVSTFYDLKESPIKKEVTQVPIASSKIKEEEFLTLTQLFTEEEIDIIAEIITNLKSYGVYPIKELMDKEKKSKVNKIKRAFLSLW